MPQGMAEGSKATQFKPLTEPLEVHFHESYIPEPNSGCWLWVKDTDNKGYGRIRRDGKTILAHRVSYELHVNKTKKFVLHWCGNSHCVNPDHLYAGTQKENMRDRDRHGRTNIPIGEKHPGTHLTNSQVLAIREDTRAQTVIGREYGICQATVSLIKTKKNWGHL